MSVDLPPYNPEATCPKCGHDDVHTRYEPTAHHHSCQVREMVTDPVCCTAEHMERTCRRCGYQWPEACMAAPS